jgi:carboxymethylenebutenolidase
MACWPTHIINEGTTVVDSNFQVATGRPCFVTPAGKLSGYLAHPSDAGRHPAVLVIHENTGLNRHIEKVVQRFAQEGFVAFALDALSLTGGTPEDEDTARSAIGALDDDQNRANYLASLDYLRHLPGSDGKVASVGFCWGGKVSGELAVADPNLDAAVIYYGKSPASDEVAGIVAPLLLHYGENDDRINATVPEFQSALEHHGKQFQLNMYKGAGHAFNNESREDRFEPNAAAESWSRTIAFLNSELASQL